MNTTLTSEKIADYAVMLCDALYMNLKCQQIRGHQNLSKSDQRTEQERVYHASRALEIMENGPDAEFYLETGRKYFKLIYKTCGCKSAHAFIDRETGNVYKAASWRGPAKIARFCLMNDEQREWLYANADWAGGYLYIR